MRHRSARCRACRRAASPPWSRRKNSPWPSIPYSELMQALIEKSCGVARNGTLSVPKSSGITGVATPPVFKEGKFWCDYEIA